MFIQHRLPQKIVKICAEESALTNHYTFKGKIFPEDTKKVELSLIV